MVSVRVRFVEFRPGKAVARVKIDPKASEELLEDLAETITEWLLHSTTVKRTVKKLLQKELANIMERIPENMDYNARWIWVKNGEGILEIKTEGEENEYTIRDDITTAAHEVVTEIVLERIVEKIKQCIKETFT